ncbi:heme ABC exporter ATP-binding protein CcmA [Thermoflexus sp.]|uniref:heme ABC exporter ATP-binding protein CcmA n=1 Tax=Thermoflexus sp. TaxID=1969742 RepID=UPI0035E3FD91
MEPSPVLRLERVSKAFGPRWALREVSLSVWPGEILALMGPNGAGKSTLLRVAATLLRPASGAVWVKDRRWPPDGAGVRAEVVLLGHQPWFYPDLTAEENLRFYQRFYGWPEDRWAVRAALERMGLAERAHERVRGFSRGMLQRLALARALLAPTPVLLLDEPFTGLDVEGLERAREAVRELAAGGRAVVLAIHDPSTADLAHRVVVLVGGRLVAEGPPAAFHEKALRDLYRGGVGPPGATPSHRSEGPSVRPSRAPEGSPRAVGRETGRSADAGVLSIPPTRSHTAPPTAHPARAASIGDVSLATREKGRMVSLPSPLRPLLALLWKDLRVEGRGRETLAPLLTLAGLSLFLFGAAFELRPDLARAFVPVFLWMLLLFASSLGVGRMMASEIDRGTWEGLLMVPGDRSLLFWGKAVVHGLLLVFVLVLSLVAAGVFFNLSLWDPVIVALLLLGIAGLGGVTTLLAAMAMATRARELLLPILLFPVAAPLLIAGIQGVRAVLEADPSGWGTWMQIMIAYDLMLFTVAWLVFEELVSA